MEYICCIYNLICTILNCLLYIYLCLPLCCLGVNGDDSGGPNVGCDKTGPSTRKPIYSRYYPWCVRPIHVCEPEDLWDAWSTIHPENKTDRLKPVLGQIRKFKAPNLVFIGDSNVYRLGLSVKKETLNSDLMTFLSSSKFVGVGGTKWWLIETELHGIFDKAWKLKKHGDQWSKYFDSDAVSDAGVIILGSNDCDDYNNCILQACPTGAIDENLDNQQQYC